MEAAGEHEDWGFSLESGAVVVAGGKEAGKEDGLPRVGGELRGKKRFLGR